ncbi:DnaJ-domain-containing protein [Russula earlei]|uniref:DnaJ-domain-containing protein n=1 Tax=Russula earlei TaxID=71964 RepID=A0ACC0UAR8_9AGAM|nr:DnaJ-domain-containing protein [Russula earlei]
MAGFPDYYVILNVPKDASTEEIRQAYRRESLKTHPDRLFNASAEEKKAATEKFQAVADAYYTLSDPRRRRDYDGSSSSSEWTSDPNASNSFFPTFASMFSSGAGNGQPGTAAPGEPPGGRPNADRVFGDVFEDLLRPEVERHVPQCGAGLGFITANMPGLVVGAYTGNRLGAIRDAKGKSVAAVFAELSGAQKAEILRALALKVLGVAYT